MLHLLPLTSPKESAESFTAAIFRADEKDSTTKPTSQSKDLPLEMGRTLVEVILSDPSKRAPFERLYDVQGEQALRGGSRFQGLASSLPGLFSKVLFEEDLDLHEIACKVGKTHADWRVDTAVFIEAVDILKDIVRDKAPEVYPKFLKRIRAFEVMAARVYDERLNEARSRLNLVLNTIQEGVVVGDSQGSLLFANESYARLIGKPLEEILKNGWKGLGVIEDPGVSKPFFESIERGLSDEEELEEVFVTPKGKRTVRTVYKPFDSGEKRWVLASHVDITELKEAQARSERVGAFARDIIERSVSGVVGASQDGTIRMANETAKRMLCLQGDESYSILERFEPEMRNTRGRVALVLFGLGFWYSFGVAFRLFGRMQATRGKGAGTCGDRSLESLGF